MAREVGVQLGRSGSWALVAVLSACAASEVETGSMPEDDPTTVTTSPQVESSPTETESDTGTPPPAFDCGDPPPPPFLVQRIDIQTEEDFDFDATGYLMYQNGSDLVGIDQLGTFKILAPNASSDPAGLQVLSTGDIALSDPAEGVLKLFDGVTGGSQVLMSNVSRINGIEIAADNRIYYSEMVANGHVGWIDPYTGERGIVATNLNNPNGLALAPDEQRLYVAAGLTFNDAYIMAVDLVGTNTWSAPYIVLEAQNNDTFDGIEVDSCGVVYTVGFSYGNVLRTWPDLDITEKIAQLSDSSYSSMRFGNGLGGWERDHLYITNRDDIHSIDVDVLGRPHPTNP